jgi:large subunit ribosomal protein L35
MFPLFNRAASSGITAINCLKHVVSPRAVKVGLDLTRSISSAPLLNLNHLGQSYAKNYLREPHSTSVRMSGVSRMIFTAAPITRSLARNEKNTLKIISRGVKTKQAAAKRFLKTGQGKLKFGHAGKRHLTSKKSKVRKQRLNKKVHVTFNVYMFLR